MGHHQEKNIGCMYEYICMHLYAIIMVVLSNYRIESSMVSFIIIIDISLSRSFVLVERQKPESQQIRDYYIT